jgi:cytoskeleton protein RodZ
MLRAARQQQGLHIAALAAAIKVSPAKLESLEAGRTHELLDVTFARALAQTVCRVLKIDPAPVLAQMPGAPPDALGRVDGGLNTPFRERPGRVVPADWAPWRHPVLWLAALLLIAAAAFVLVPSTALRDLPLPGGLPSVLPPGPATAASGAADIPVLPPADPASAALPAAVGAAPGLPASVPVASVTGSGAVAIASAANRGSGDAIALRALQPTWVQAVDGSGQTLMARLVPAGETVELTATPPLRLRIGNVSGTELSFRGKPVDLKAVARDNIANITLP